MDETSQASPITAELVRDVAHPDRRRRAHEILSQQTSRLDRLEGELSQRFQQLTDEIARDGGRRRPGILRAGRGGAQRADHLAQ